MSESEDNAAWVEAEIPLPPAALLAFLADHERLWRLNPWLAIESWHEEGDGFTLRAQNEGNDLRIDVRAWRETLPDGFRIRYGTGLKQSSEFAVATRGGGSLLRIIERYASVDGPDDPRVAETDKSLVPWVAALRRHLVARARWGRIPGWRWWNEGFMLSMPPRQRRIVRMIIWVTLIEFAVFVLAVLALRFG